jgi:superfamily I DNA/RNA helicase
MEDALRKEIFRIAFMVVYLLSKERNKDVLCYLRLVINPKDEEALRVINYPRELRYNSRKTYDCCQSLQAFHLGSDAKY